MTTPKTLDRKTFLTSSVAAFATVTLGGCGGESGDGGDDNTGGTSTGGTAGTATGGSSGSATGGSAMGGSSGAGGSAPTGGTGGTGSGGDGGGGGGTLTCMATMAGDHVHPLTIPPSDIERGYQDAPYILQDGGTGHTHTLTLDSYEFVYLNAGVEMEHESTVDAGHSHLVTMDCAR